MTEYFKNNKNEFIDAPKRKCNITTKTVNPPNSRDGGKAMLILGATLLFVNGVDSMRMEPSNADMCFKEKEKVTIDNKKVTVYHLGDIVEPQRFSVLYEAHFILKSQTPNYDARAGFPTNKFFTFGREGKICKWFENVGRDLSDNILEQAKYNANTYRAFKEILLSNKQHFVSLMAQGKEFTDMKVDKVFDDLMEQEPQEHLGPEKIADMKAVMQQNVSGMTGKAWNDVTVGDLNTIKNRQLEDFKKSGLYERTLTQEFDWEDLEEAERHARHVNEQGDLSHTSSFIQIGVGNIAANIGFLLTMGVSLATIGWAILGIVAFIVLIVACSSVWDNRHAIHDRVQENWNYIQEEWHHVKDHVKDGARNLIT